MSFVTDVLLAAGQLDKRDYQGEIEELNNKINQAQREVELFLEKHYAEFVPLHDGATYLATLSTKLLSDFNSFKDKVDRELKLQMQFSTHEMSSLAHQLEASETQLEILSDVVEMHDIITSLRNVSPSSELVLLTEKTMKASSILAQAESSLGFQLEIWTGIKEKLAHHKSSLNQHLENAWKSTFLWTLNGDKVILNIRQTGKLADLCRAHAQMETLSMLLHVCSSVLLDEILTPLTNPASEVNITNSGDSASIEVLKEKADVQTAADVLQVLGKYQKVFEAFETLFSFEVLPGQTLLRLIGRQIGSTFTVNFIKKCLKPALPDCSGELRNDQFTNLIEFVTHYDRRLHENGFLDEKETSLKDFVDNIDTFLVNKKCQQTLTKAREIMCRPLHDTELTGETDIKNSTVDESSRLQDLWETMNEGNIELRQSPFLFPRCQVSKNVKEVRSIIEALLEESLLSQSGARLICTARFVCEMYISIVPEYHRKEIEELPFHAAVAHNNCMYLAHYLITLGCRFTDAETRQCITFADVVNELRLLGANLFLTHLRIQRDRLVTMIQDGGFSCLAGEPRLPNSSETAVSQSLLHLASLQKIWNSILPEEVLFKALGTLTNSLVQELLGKITVLEDIPAEAALQLVGFCQTLLQRLPDLFQSNTDTKDRRELELQANRFVASWAKFQELERLLGASLKEIEDRWAAGKGPLATHFTAVEVKQLVRALFQNTDLRAAVLTRIR